MPVRSPVASLLSLAAILLCGRSASAQEPEPQRPIRVCAGGDVTLGTNLDPKWPSMAAQRLRAQFGLSADPASLVAPLRPLFADANVVLVNVETAIGQGPFTPKCTKRSKNCFSFRSDPGAAAAIRSIGDSSAAVVGNVANNHARDAGNEGVDSTIAHLTRARVLVTGADTLATPIVLSDGQTIAVLGFVISALIIFGLPALAVIAVKYFKLKERELTVDMEYRQKSQQQKVALEQRVQRLEDVLTSLDRDVRVRLGIEQPATPLTSRPDLLEGPVPQAEPGQPSDPSRTKAR